MADCEGSAGSSAGSILITTLLLVTIPAALGGSQSFFDIYASILTASPLKEGRKTTSLSSSSSRSHLADKSASVARSGVISSRLERRLLRVQKAALAKRLEIAEHWGLNTDEAKNLVRVSSLSRLLTMTCSSFRSHPLRTSPPTSHSAARTWPPKRAPFFAPACSGRSSSRRRRR